MARIKKIIGREILDSRGMPTVEVIVELEDASVGIFSTPSGLSTGKHEAFELRDGDPKRYAGKGVLKSLQNIARTLGPSLIGHEASDQKGIDTTMLGLDNTKNKERMGANSILAISGAVAKAQAESRKIPLYQYIAELCQLNSRQFLIPTPMFNILNGGKHGGGNVDFQEFMIVPPRASVYSKNLRMGAEIYYSLKDTIMLHNAAITIGDEGGYAPILFSNLDAFKVIAEAASQAGYQIGIDVFLAIDVAASNIKQGGSYKIKDRPVPLLPSDFIDFYIGLMEQFRLISIEDPLAEDDWDDWQDLLEKIGDQTIIVGDDLTATNLERLNKAISEKAISGIIIKPNQSGTVSETLEVVKTAKKNNIKIITSHRSGETNDDFIADFAVGINSDYVKFGAPARGERVAKYNRLLEIEHDLS